MGALKVWNGVEWEYAALGSPHMPTGVITPVGAAAPAGSLLCDGGTFDSGAYPALAAYLGDTHGVHTGTTYYLPDLRGRGPMGYDPSQNEFNTLGETGGAKTHTLTVSEMPSHKHNTSHSVSTGGSNFYIPKGGGGTLTQGVSANPIATEGDGQAHNNLQPYLALNFVIWT